MHWRHGEAHNTHCIGWLRAAVLGANDGAITVASLVVGIAAAGTDRNAFLQTRISASVAGAMTLHVPSPPIHAMSWG